MVNRTIKLLSLTAAAITLVFLPGVRGNAKQNDAQAMPQMITAGTDETGGDDVGIGDVRARLLPDPDKEEGTSRNVLQGPDIPPDGMRYDEWKGFQYTTDTKFDVKTYWSICMEDHSLASDHGLFRDPGNIEDGVLEIIDARSEPVGGEMKLRSGGFVDITIELYSTGTMCGYCDTRLGNPFSLDWYVMWSDNCPDPCDAYTGTSLLNYASAENPENDSIEPGQADDTSLVESDVTWGSRTYRLFAKSDIRNASFSDWSIDTQGEITYFKAPAAIEITLTFRVPADYDGLVLAIDKDKSDQRSENIDEKTGDFLHYSDLYADVLTTGKGTKKPADYFYFVKVSDLLKHFEGQKNSGGQ